MSVLLFNTFAKYKKDLADFQIWTHGGIPAPHFVDVGTLVAADGAVMLQLPIDGGGTHMNDTFTPEGRERTG